MPGARCARNLPSYGGGLADKPEIIALNKADAMTPREASARRAALAKASGQPVLLMSGVSGAGRAGGAGGAVARGGGGAGAARRGAA